MSALPAMSAAAPSTPAAPAMPGATSGACATPDYNRFGVFAECPHCGGDMAPEHAHYRCGACGWRDSCCD